jgi:soluble lytic murein transglycosylase-like protein
METVVEQSEKYDLMPEILVAMIHRESRWKPWVESRAGACGLTQVIPGYTKPRKKCGELKKPRVSITAGARALNYWVYEYANGDYLTGLCGYNGGYNCPALSRSKAYARSVMKYAEKISRQVQVRRAHQDLLRYLDIKPEIKFETK